jgi:hypothetical protein
MLLTHPRVRMAQIPGDDVKWSAGHDTQTGVGVAQNMEADRRHDPSSATGLMHRFGLM